MTELKPAYDFPAEVRMLFAEYTQMLVQGEPSFREYLDIQHYDEEIGHLQEKYGPPAGRLYLAFCGGEPAGCIGLRQLDAQSCEMKRLYVRLRFRGKGIGGMLVQRIIGDAKEIGYRQMFLDTLPFLQSALKLYKGCGFCETERYNDSPVESSIFMRLEL